MTQLLNGLFLSITDVSKRHKPIDLTLRIEPTIIALGSKHVAAGANNRVFYTRISSSGQTQRRYTPPKPEPKIVEVDEDLNDQIDDVSAAINELMKN